MNRILSMFAMAWLLSGCTTIHFDNGDFNNGGSQAQSGQTTQQRWHHNAVYDLVEVSEPVDLKQECDQKQWSSVRRELSFQNFLLSLPVNLFGPIWYPKTITVVCQ